MALLAAYKFDEASGAVTDYSGNGRGFTLTGNTVRTAAGNGYTYGGTEATSKGLTQTAAGVQQGPAITGLNTLNRTIMCWMIGGPADPSWFLEFHRAGADDTGVWGWLYLSGQLRFRAKNSANTPFERNLTTDAGAFHHLAATHDGTNLKVYRDGVQVGADVSMPFPVWDADDFRIFDNSGSGPVVDEVRIYDQALDAATIASLANTPVTISGASMAVNTRTLQYHMNRKAGTLVGGIPTRDAQAAANIWAGTTGKDLVGALNIRAGNTFPNWRDLAGVLNQLAGTTGLDVDGAAANIP